MPGRFRPPMLAMAAAMLVLIAVLATLQYRWLGRISDAERERLTTTLSARADAYATDFDRELALAYMLFQLEPTIAVSTAPAAESLPARLAARHDRWQETARYPKLIRELYVTARAADGAIALQRFNPSTELLEPVEWPASLTAIRGQLGESHEEKTANGTLVVRTIAPALWDEVPALVVPGAPTPLVLLNAPVNHTGVRLSPNTSMSYIVLLLDRQFIAGEMLPALAAHHFSATGDDPQYQLAVVETGRSAVVYQSAAGFSPPPAAKADASADLFQVRLQEFPQLVAEVGVSPRSRHHPASWNAAQALTTFRVPLGPNATAAGRPPGETKGAVVDHQVVLQDAPRSLIVGQNNGFRDRSVMTTVTGTAAQPPAPRWRLLVKHPSGSLEAAVSSARRRNLIVSSSILAVLGASLGLLVVSTRRAQELARQQMEFVAAVSHELRTPLAVIRSAADNLADGVVARRSADQEVRRTGARRRAPADRDGRADPGVRRASTQASAVDAAAGSRRALLREVVAASAIAHRRRRPRGRVRYRRQTAAGLGDEAGAAPRVPEPDRQRDQVRRRGRWIGIARAGAAGPKCA